MSLARPGPVLVVDDHKLNRRLLERLIELEGLAAVGAESIAQADRMIARLSPPLIVLDLQLPDGHGLDLARRLKHDPRTAGFTVVACSACSLRGEQQLSVEAGCAAYVSKPIDTRRFGELIVSLLARDGRPPPDAPHADAA
jgi:CheY-like chemotaxis protein